MNKQLLSKTGLILAVILFIAFIIVVNGNFKSARVDLPEDNVKVLLFRAGSSGFAIIESLCSTRSGAVDGISTRLRRHDSGQNY